MICVLGVAIPILLAFVWAIALYLFAGVFIITLLIVEVAFMIALCVFLCTKAGWLDGVEVIDSVVAVGNNATDGLLDTASGDEQTMYSVLAVLAILLTVINVILLIMWRKCIFRLIAIVRESTKVFKAMMLIVIWPWWSFILQASPRARAHARAHPCRHCHRHTATPPS